MNEIFDPERVDTFYNFSIETRQKLIRNDKATNYSVVRQELLNLMYENMYHQRLREPDPRKWRQKIVSWRQTIGYENCSDSRLFLKLQDTLTGEVSTSEASFDLVILGTGYERNGHETILECTRHLLQEENPYGVERNYRLKFRKDAVADECGIWLQGCCEDSHGVSLGACVPPCNSARVQLVGEIFTDHVRSHA